METVTIQKQAIVMDADEKKKMLAMLTFCKEQVARGYDARPLVNDGVDIRFIDYAWTFFTE